MLSSGSQEELRMKLTVNDNETDKLTYSDLRRGKVYTSYKNTAFFYLCVEAAESGVRLVAITREGIFSRCAWYVFEDETARRVFVEREAELIVYE
jgi:hypothetical protein